MTGHNQPDGSMLMVDKPYGWTSFDVVRKLRGALGIKKIGHAGTLDPLATGLLILCTGKMTKKINDYQNMEKEYEGTLVLGKTTPSIDLETAVDSEQDISQLTEAQVRQSTGDFTGTIEQIPPVFTSTNLCSASASRTARPYKRAPATASSAKPT
jgi:tRNA pseudouridine55 synthase